jgi:integrase/recombinase XerD
VPGYKPRLHLPYDQWPAEDRRLWETAVGDDDPFSDAGTAHLADATLRQRWFAWRRFLGFLAIEEPVALAMAPAERLILERVRRFCAHLAATNTPYSIAIAIDALYGAARVMLPGRDWAWLKTVKARLHTAAPARGARGPVITSLQLLDLGQQLMDESEPTPGGRIRRADAVKYRDGLMIALCAFVPPRRKNLSAMQIGRHLIQEGDNWFVIFSPDETKTRNSLEYPVPALLTPYLVIYLDMIRPRMLRDLTCKALWVSQKGGPLSYSAIWFVVTRHTEERLGIHVAPHDVRDAAATTWAIASPAQISAASDLLGHSSPRTLKSYNRAKGIEASRGHAATIAAIRRRRGRRMRAGD